VCVKPATLVGPTPQQEAQWEALKKFKSACGAFCLWCSRFCRLCDPFLCRKKLLSRFIRPRAKYYTRSPKSTHFLIYLVRGFVSRLVARCSHTRGLSWISQIPDLPKCQKWVDASTPKPKRSSPSTLLYCLLSLSSLDGTQQD
jgi:hypothetical protein